MRQTRHLILAALGLALVAGGPGEARPRASASPVGTVIDVSHLRALGLGPTADLVQRTLAGELAGLPAGRVVVRVTGLSLNSYAGSDSGGGGSGDNGGGGGGGTNDYLEGDLTVLGPGGEVLSQRHQVSSSPSSSGGPYYLPGAEQRRVEALSRSFAGWLRRSAM